MALRASPTWAERKFMKNLRFKKGAVVKFCIVGCDTLWGRVVNLADTEVEICYQQQVSTTGELFSKDLPYDNKFITADTDHFVTIDAEKICTWEYYRFSYCNRSTTYFCRSIEEFNSLHISHYKNGICTGDENGVAPSSESPKVDVAFAGEFKG